MRDDFSHIDSELQPLLEVLRHHGDNRRRQEALASKIDQLDVSAKRHRWIWIGSTVAAVGLILVLIFPLQKETSKHPSMGLVAESNFTKEMVQQSVQESSPTASITTTKHPSRSHALIETDDQQDAILADTIALPLAIEVASALQLAEAAVPLEAPQTTQVFIRESTRLVAKSSNSSTRKSKELPITFLAMSSANEGDEFPNSITIKDFKL
ncbi:MAG: hypothetical protein KBT45_02130 [Bacteroidales bacterium]|nr:hypothetical protein [Candidatus Colimorpha pelethequi]